MTRHALAGAAWASVVAWLLRRALRQFAAFRTTRLPVATCLQDPPRVTVIIPARDEAPNIGPCLDSVLAQTLPASRMSVLVVDDGSTDETPDEVLLRAASDPRVRLIRAGALPAGWLGKPRACWLGALEAVDADWLCFLDADVQAQPLALASALDAAQAGKTAFLSLQPRQCLGSFWERLVIPAGMLVIACGLPAEARPATVNGQFLLVDAAAYRAVGGHAAVRDAVCEDNALAERMLAGGHRVQVMAAEHLLQVRMYRGFASLWEGFSKNATEIMGSGPATVRVAAAALLAAWAVPLVPAWLGVAAWRRARSVPAARTSRLPGFTMAIAASAVALGVQAGTLRHFRVTPWLLPLFPAGATVVAVIAAQSVLLRRAGRVRWKGRVYGLDSAGGLC